MEPPCTTTSATASSIRAWQERKLLHWVNSLPLPKCLLVEALADLRFGDVLLDIIHWLQGQRSGRESTSLSESLAPGDVSFPVLDRLRAVLRFVARESRSDDHDALFLVNEAQCAERVKRGDQDAICAVLSILKRISDQVAREKSDEKAKHESEGDAPQSLRYLSFERELQRLATNVDSPVAHHRNAIVPPAKSNGKNLRIVGLSSARFRDESRRANNTIRSPSQMENAVVAQLETSASHRSITGLKKRVLQPKTTQSRSHGVPTHRDNRIPMFRDHNGLLHVYGMIDPSAKKSASTDPSAPSDARQAAMEASPSLERQTAARVCEWMDSLGLVLPRDLFFAKHRHGVLLPAKRVRQAFDDGVILCQLAGALAKRHGGSAGKCDLHALPGSPPGVLMPQGSVSHPRSSSQKRSNVSVALDILGRLVERETASKDDEACSKLKCYFRMCGEKGGHSEHAEGSIWGLLDQVRLGVQASPSKMHPLKDTEAKLERKLDKSSQSRTAISSKKPVDEEFDENPKLSANVSRDHAVSQGGKRRPYFTSEQMHAVDRWLERIDRGISKVRSRSFIA